MHAPFLQQWGGGLIHFLSLMAPQGNSSKNEQFYRALHARINDTWQWGSGAQNHPTAPWQEKQPRKWDHLAWLHGISVEGRRQSARSTCPASFLPTASSPKCILHYSKRQPRRQWMLPRRTLVLHKHDTEWRGQGIMVRDICGNLTRIQGAPGVLTAIVGKDSNRTGLIPAHLPPEATLDETEVLGTCRPCNNPASCWVLTAMRPSTLRGKRSDPEQRGVKRFLYRRSTMTFDFHSSRALFRPTSLITLPNNHAGSTTSG